MEILSKIAAVIVSVLLYGVLVLLQSPTKARADDSVVYVNAPAAIAATQAAR